MSEATVAETPAGRNINAQNDEYNDMHKLVLQGMMSTGILDAKGVKKLFIAACSYLQLPSEERTSMAYVQKVVRDINGKIKPFDMAIRSASCELTGKKFYIFLITVEKPLMKLQTLFSGFEVGLFQQIIDAVFRKYPSFSVPFTECINLASEVEARGNLDQAEAFIRKMMEMQYLTKFPLAGEDFNITMGIRGIRELEPLLRDCYGEFLGKCSLCKSLMLHGLLCPQCRILIHKHCYGKYLNDLKEVAACPNCNYNWRDKSRMLVRVRDEDFFEYEIATGSGLRSHYNDGMTPDDRSPPDLDMAGSPLEVDNDNDIASSPEDIIPMPTLSRMSLAEPRGSALIQQKVDKRANRQRHLSSSSSNSS